MRGKMNKIVLTPPTLAQPHATYRPFGAFRFLLASMVVISHTHTLAGEPLAFLAPLGIGNMGVMTFFILSGYVIAEAVTVFYSNRPGAFLLNRSLRIYPPFAVALVLSVGIHALVASIHELKFYDDIAAPEKIFAATNITANALSLIVLLGLERLGLSVEYPFVRYSWAVAVELQFYIAFAFLYFLVKGRGSLTIVVLALIAVFAFAMPNFGSRGWIPYFMCGVALFHLQRKAGTLLAAVSIVLLNWHAYVYIARNPDANVIGCLVILDALILMLWILSVSEIPKSLKRLDKFLGDITYPLYLNHYAISIVMLTLFWNERNMVLFLVTYVLSVAFSYLAMLCTEPLTRTLRDRIRGQRL